MDPSDIIPILSSLLLESLVGKNVVITGASSGIGEQLAYRYAQLGANVFITARREHILKEVSYQGCIQKD